MNGKSQLQKKVLVIGGGTGTFVVLKGLKYYPVTLGVIVAMSDSGGSNSRIRDEFGLLPTSDIRQCLVALSDEKKEAGLMRKLFMYRFSRGKGIEGMTFGNLFMAALSDILGSQKDAIEQTGRVLRIKGKIIPVTYSNTNLIATYQDGTKVSGEHDIDEPKHNGKLHIDNIKLKPAAAANPMALSAIAEADMIVFGPGDLFTSVLANLAVKGIKEAICKSNAKKVYVLNLMTKYGQTYNYRATDHLNWIQKYLDNTLDYVLVNNASLNQTALKLYEKSEEIPVSDDLKDGDVEIIRRDLVSTQLTEKTKSDILVRSLIRHDSDKLAAALMQVLLDEV